MYPCRLGELLLKEDAGVSPAAVRRAPTTRRRTGASDEKAFIDPQLRDQRGDHEPAQGQSGVPSINLDHFKVDPTVIKMIPLETARKYQCCRSRAQGGILTLAMADPTNVFAMDDIKFMAGFNIEPVVASESVVEEAMDRECVFELMRSLAVAA